jgi:hypothetical protein
LLQTPIAPHASRSPAAPPQYQSIQESSPQNYYLPQTPQSGDNATDNDGNGAHDGGPNDPKRPRACEACRGLKVRCEPDPNNQDGPCKRCAKANRNCVVTVPSRKRQKKTDSRVAELEKKIDALTASLHAQKSGSASVTHNDGTVEQEVPTTQARQNPYQQVTNGGYGSAFARPPEVRGDEWAAYLAKAPEFENRKSSAPPMVVAGQKRKHVESFSAASDSPMSGVARKSVDGSSAPQLPIFLIDPGTKPPQTHEYADVVDRGLVTADMAAKMFDCYVDKMAPHMPAVVFPPGTTAAEIRKTKPTLFLAILSASSGSNFPELQRALTKEVMNIYAERIICNGEKTLELVQALQISSLWYFPPEHFEELKFYQLIHIAAVMAIDIGMGKRTKSQKAKAAGLWRDHPWRRTPYPDPESAEARRAWLGCYFLCCSASMGLRRPNLIRWTPFMMDCLEFLENSPEAAATDRALCNWVRSQHIGEEIGTQFSMDDPTASVSIADSKVQYALKGFERDLEKWSSQVPTEAQSRKSCPPKPFIPLTVDLAMLKMSEHVVNLYMHEVALHVDHNVEEFKPPFTEDTLRGVGDTEQVSLTAAQISALSVCLTSIDGIFETFLKLDVETVRCLPAINFVRIAYAVVVLIKMYFAAVTPNSELGKVINKDNMKVEQYLDGLVDIFKASAAEEKSRPAAKFLMVLIMLKTWFHRQREGKPPQPGEPTILSDIPVENHSDKQKGNTQQRGGQQPGYSPANTPLQLLSEVATGNSGGQSRSGSISQYPGSSNEWQQPQQQNYTNYPLMTQVPITQYGNVNMGGNIDPSLGMDLSYTMGDGLEQAMGMTIGAGAFGEYFSFNDDTFINGLMDSVGGAPVFDGI